jgi:hypothetical protein
LQQAALDIITPLLGQDVPFITVNQVIDALKGDRFGIAINRAIVLQILDPEVIKAVSKIEGDRVYLKEPEGADHEVDAEDKQQEQDHVADMSQQQAAKDVQS